MYLAVNDRGIDSLVLSMMIDNRINQLVKRKEGLDSVIPLYILYIKGAQLDSLEKLGNAITFSITTFNSFKDILSTGVDFNIEFSSAFFIKSPKDQNNLIIEILKSKIDSHVFYEYFDNLKLIPNEILYENKMSNEIFNHIKNS